MRQEPRVTEPFGEGFPGGAVEPGRGRPGVRDFEAASDERSDQAREDVPRARRREERSPRRVDDNAAVRRRQESRLSLEEDGAARAAGERPRRRQPVGLYRAGRRAEEARGLPRVRRQKGRRPPARESRKVAGERIETIRVEDDRADASGQ